MRLIGCVRVSRVGGRAGDSFISPQVQRDQVEAYARARGHKIVGWQEDLDKPGSTLNRPGLQAALAAVDRGEADGIIAAKLDRITRSLSDLGRLLERALAGGWNIVAVDVGLDMATPNGKLIAHMLGAIAEWELDRRRADWSDARERAVDRGVHIASKTPTGYRRLKDGRLEPSEDAPVIAELFRKRAAGVGWRALGEFLTDAAVVTPYGNLQWSPGSVNALIRNRVYLGEARSGEFIAAEAHEAIVSEREWRAAQMARGLPSARVGPPALLSGLIRCSGCRYLMKVDSMRDRKRDRLVMYSCRRIHAAGKCPRPVTVLARVVDPLVEEAFLAALQGENIAVEAARTSSALTAAGAELEVARGDLGAYISTDALAIAGKDAFEVGLAVRRERVDVAVRAVEDLRVRSAPLGDMIPGDLVEAWPRLDVAHRRRLLAAGLECVVVWPHASGSLPGERMGLIWRGDAPDDLPRRGRRVPLAPWPDRPGDFRVQEPEDL